MNSVDFEIPIDGAIKDFVNHLKANPRTILSSRFGDGKSYFLNKLQNDAVAKEDFEFITIYPINYQIADNKDIFELLKLDILCQLILNDMISDKVELNDDERKCWYFFKQHGSLLTEIVSSLSSLNFNSKILSSITDKAKLLKLAQKLKAGYQVFKKKDIKSVDMFFQDKGSGFMFENDFVSVIITRSIKSLQVDKKKKVVLLIEDLDRMDPAHIFRILNVFSAHMDYGFRNGSTNNSDVEKNKFGIDNIVFSVDYNNLEHIYHHFYGSNTSFEGYISKFLSSNYFKYSLEATKEKYVVDLVSRITGISSKVVNKFVNIETIKNLTIRDLVKSFDVSNQIISQPYALDNKGEERVKLDTSFLKLLAVLRRMKLSDDKIIEKVIVYQEIDESWFYQYVGAFLFEEQMQKSSPSDSYIIVNDNGTRCRCLIELDKEKGVLAPLGTRFLSGGPYTDFEPCIRRMLEFVGM